MQINKIETTKEFDRLTKNFRTLNVWHFGPLVDLDKDIDVLIGQVNGETVAYLIAEHYGLWHIETKYKGHGYARKLVEEAEIDFVFEVCSDTGVEFCKALNLEFEDCRGDASKTLPV